MPHATVSISSTFVGRFPVGDNLVYNAQILCDLVECNDRGKFNKPIVIQVASLLETALLEIIFRAKHYNLEGVNNITKDDQQEIAQKNIDKFYAAINIFCKYKLLDGFREDIYDNLHKLRKLRNKIHIHSSVDDEPRLFSVDLSKWAVNLNLSTLRYLSTNFNGTLDYVDPLVVPAEQV